MEKMQFEIDDTLLDKLIVDTLKRDYISQQEDINRLLTKTEPLRDFEREDLWMHRETAEGIAIVLRYYMYRPDADAFINQNTYP
jgi:hypothetical protein